MTDTKKLLQDRLAELQAKKAEIDEQVAPLNEKREAANLTAEQARLDAQKYRDERDTILKEVGYLELTREISTVAKALGGRAMSDNRG